MTVYAFDEGVATWIRQRTASDLDFDQCRNIALQHALIVASGFDVTELKQRAHAQKYPFIPKEQHAKGHISLGQRQRLYATQSGRCAYCNRLLSPLGVHLSPRKERVGIKGPDVAALYADHPQLEHRIPLARGGTWDISNLCYACRPCNNNKSTMTDDEFTAWRQGDYAPWRELSLFNTILHLEALGYTGLGEDVPWPSSATWVISPYAPPLNRYLADAMVPEPSH